MLRGEKIQATTHINTGEVDDSGEIILLLYVAVARLYWYAVCISQMKVGTGS